MKNNYNIVTKKGMVQLYRNGYLIHNFLITPRKNEHDPKKHRTYSHFDAKNSVILFFQRNWSRKNILNLCNKIIKEEEQ